jgi:hypothetical protein
MAGEATVTVGAVDKGVFPFPAGTVVAVAMAVVAVAVAGSAVANPAGGDWRHEARSISRQRAAANGRRFMVVIIQNMAGRQAA